MPSGFPALPALELGSRRTARGPVRARPSGCLPASAGHIPPARVTPAGGGSTRTAGRSSLARLELAARVREHALDAARAHALDAARELGRVDPDLDPLLTLGRASALDLARDLARRTAWRVGDVLGLRQVEGLAAALLEGALDDFTNADLARADVAGRNLTGIRWSDWGTDTDELRARSREIAPGTGIYKVTRPGDGRDRHHASA